MPHVPPGQMDCAQCAKVPASDLLEQVECARTENQAAGYQHRVLTCADPVTDITRWNMLSWQKALSNYNDILIRVRTCWQYQMQLKMQLQTLADISRVNVHRHKNKDVAKSF